MADCDRLWQPARTVSVFADLAPKISAQVCDLSVRLCSSDQMGSQESYSDHMGSQGSISDHTASDLNRDQMGCPGSIFDQIRSPGSINDQMGVSDQIGSHNYINKRQ